MIKYGSVEYFTLLSLQDKLYSFDYDKLGLDQLDKLRMEVKLKVEAIHLQHNQEKKDDRTS